MPVNSLLLSVLVSLAVPGRSNLMKPVFFIENQPWQNTTHAGYVGHFKIPITVESPSWWIALIYDQPVTEFKAWQARLMKTSHDKHVVYKKETIWNGYQYPGMVMDQRYLVGYEKKADVDYSEYTGPRPTIVFRDHVYIPDPTKTLEHEMTVMKTTDMLAVSNDQHPIHLSTSQRCWNFPTYCTVPKLPSAAEAFYMVVKYDFPASFEMLPVLTVTTSAPSTVSPLTKGRNAGSLRRVFTDQQADERSGLRPVSRATTKPTTAPTTTEESLPGWSNLMNPAFFYDFPVSFEMMSGLTVTTSAPSTITPLTEGRNAASFERVLADQQADKRSGSRPITRATTKPTTVPTTTEESRMSATSRKRQEELKNALKQIIEHHRSRGSQEGVKTGSAIIRKALLSRWRDTRKQVLYVKV